VGQSAEHDALIRVVVTLESQFKSAVHDNARWFVTTQGVLGEFYLAIEPGTSDRPVLKDGAVVRGISPPRLDLLLSEAYELLHRAFIGITDNEQKLGETFDALITGVCAETKHLLEGRIIGQAPEIGPVGADRVLGQVPLGGQDPQELLDEDRQVPRRGSSHHGLSAPSPLLLRTPHSPPLACV